VFVVFYLMLRAMFYGILRRRAVLCAVPWSVRLSVLASCVVRCSYGAGSVRDGTERHPLDIFFILVL